MSGLQPHEQRVVDEKTELDERRAKLNAFFDSSIFKGLNKDEQGRLEHQGFHMTCYSDILAARIAAF